MNKVCLGIVAAALLLPAVAVGAVVNGGFEAEYLGLPGWESNINPELLPLAGAVPSLGNYSNEGPASWLPTEGEQFAFIQTGLNVSDRPHGIFIRQDITLQPGEAVAFDLFFATQDSLPYDDRAYVSLLGLGWSYNIGVADVGPRGSTGNWLHLQTSANTGFLPITTSFGVSVWDSNEPRHLHYPSAVGIDNVRVVPEPGVCGLLGLLALVARRR